MKKLSRSSNDHEFEQYKPLAESDDGQSQRNLLTEEEERELATTTDRQERRRIQNRVAQRAYRQKQKRRFQQLEERLTSFHVGCGALPEVDADAFRPHEGIDAPNTWSSLATSYPISTTITSHMSRGQHHLSPSVLDLPSAAASNMYQGTSGTPEAPETDRYPHAVGYIQPAAADIPDDVTPFVTISILPIRIAVLMNLEIIGIGLQQYRSDNATSPFHKDLCLAKGSEPVPMERVISKLVAFAPGLIPTRTQLETEHHPYIDIIPSGAIRDRILGALNETVHLDQDALCCDIEWGVRVWGKTPWDERSWEWSAAFANKWVWLFDRETLKATNFWRVQRGEGVLDISGGLLEETGDLAFDMLYKGKSPE